MFIQTKIKCYSKVVLLLLAKFSVSLISKWVQQNGPKNQKFLYASGQTDNIASIPNAYSVLWSVCITDKLASDSMLLCGHSNDGGHIVEARNSQTIFDKVWWIHFAFFCFQSLAFTLCTRLRLSWAARDTCSAHFDWTASIRPAILKWLSSGRERPLWRGFDFEKLKRLQSAFKLRHLSAESFCRKILIENFVCFL